MAQKPPDGAPYLPPEYDLADVQALKALARGDAEEQQQKRALRWIVENACAVNDLAYHPGGENGRRDTDFALGRAFAGKQIAKLVNMPPEIMQQMREKQNGRNASTRRNARPGTGREQPDG